MDVFCADDRGQTPLHLALDSNQSWAHNEYTIEVLLRCAELPRGELLRLRDVKGKIPTDNKNISLGNATTLISYEIERIRSSKPPRLRGPELLAANSSSLSIRWRMPSPLEWLTQRRSLSSEFSEVEKFEVEIQALSPSKGKSQGSELFHKSQSWLQWRAMQTSATTATFSDLAAGTRHIFRIRAFNCNGWGIWSPVSIFATASEEEGGGEGKLAAWKNFAHHPMKGMLASLPHRQPPMPSLSLHAAARFGNVSRIKLLLSQDITLINSRNSHGSTALNLAAANGHKEVAILLLQQGADPYLKDDRQHDSFALAKKFDERQLGATQGLRRERAQGNILKRPYRGPAEWEVAMNSWRYAEKASNRIPMTSILEAVHGAEARRSESTHRFGARFMEFRWLLSLSTTGGYNFSSRNAYAGPSFRHTLENVNPAAPAEKAKTFNEAQRRSVYNMPSVPETAHRTKFSKKLANEKHNVQNAFAQQVTRMRPSLARTFGRHISTQSHYWTPLRPSFVHGGYFRGKVVQNAIFFRPHEQLSLPSATTSSTSYRHYTANSTFRRLNGREFLWIASAQWLSVLVEVPNNDDRLGKKPEVSLQATRPKFEIVVHGIGSTIDGKLRRLLAVLRGTHVYQLDVSSERDTFWEVQRGKVEDSAKKSQRRPLLLKQLHRPVEYKEVSSVRLTIRGEDILKAGIPLPSRMLRPMRRWWQKLARHLRVVVVKEQIGEDSEKTLPQAGRYQRIHKGIFLGNVMHGGCADNSEWCLPRSMAWAEPRRPRSVRRNTIPVHHGVFRGKPRRWHVFSTARTAIIAHTNPWGCISGALGRERGVTLRMALGCATVHLKPRPFERLPARLIVRRHRHVFKAKLLPDHDRLSIVRAMDELPLEREGSPDPFTKED